MKRQAMRAPGPILALGTTKTVNIEPTNIDKPNTILPPNRTER
jgi:hypothetical protein